MLSTLFWSGVIVGGSVLYTILGGEVKQLNTKTQKTDESKSNMDKTYDYFSTLTLAEQKQYFDDNLDLRYYKDEMLTDDRYFNMLHAKEISRRTGKTFDDKNKTY